MPIDEAWPTTVVTRGTVLGATVTWRQGAQLFVTVVAKVELKFATEGPMQCVDPAPFDRGQALGLSELAPSLPRCDVVMLGDANLAGVRLRIERAGQSIFDKRAAMSAFAARRPAPERSQGMLELVANHDFEGFQVAPDDQQIEHLAGNETLVLEGVDPKHARIQVQLPSLRPQIRLVTDDEAIPQPCRFDSLAIDPHNRRCVLLFRAQFPSATMSFLSRARAEVALGSHGAVSPSVVASPTPLAALASTLCLDGGLPLAEVGVHETAALDGALGRAAATPFSNAPQGPVEHKPGFVPVEQTIGGAAAASGSTLPFGRTPHAATPFDKRAATPPLAQQDLSLAGGTLSAFSDLSGAAATPFGAVRDRGDGAAGESDRAALEGAARERERVQEKVQQVRRAAEAAEKRREQETAEKRREEEAAERRREQEAVRFEQEQREAAERERAQRAEKSEKSRARAKQLRSELYGFKRRKR